MTARRCSTQKNDGSALVIALIFMLALGLVLGAIATFARTSVTNTINLKDQRTTELQATDAVMAAAQNVRRTYTSAIYTTTTGVSCLPATTLPGNPFHVYCVGSAAPGSLASRTVSFYACTTATPCVATPDVVLNAVAKYDDVPPGATPAGFSNCGMSGTSTCGIRMVISLWDLRVADS